MKLTNLILLLLLFSCGTHRDDQKIMEEAASVHDYALQIAEETEQQINTLVQVYPDSAKQFLLEIEQWEENLVEVPGHAHEHHDHEGHTHDHSPVTLTPEEMLNVQQELRDQVKALRDRVESLKRN